MGWCFIKSMYTPSSTDTKRGAGDMSDKASIKPGCKVELQNKALAWQSMAICRTSLGCNLAFTGTGQTPAIQQANKVSKNAERFSMQMMTRCATCKPNECRMPAAKAWLRKANSP